MIYPEMPADEYHGLPMFSAGLAWDIVGPDGCLALAWHRCPWLNDAYLPVPDEIVENGTMIHLAVLEDKILEQRITIIDASDYRTQKARDLRDDARANGLIPILYDRGPGSPGASFVKLQAIRKALENSAAAHLLFDVEASNEVSFTWDQIVYEEGPSPEGPQAAVTNVECKGRADRVTKDWLIDLKSAPSASPEAFQRSTATYGHHLRAAFYKDGWQTQGPDILGYLFIVVQKEPPYLVNIYELSERAEEWGRKLYRRALQSFVVARRDNLWPGYSPSHIMDLPVWAEHQLADRETAGEL